MFIITRLIISTFKALSIALIVSGSTFADTNDARIHQVNDLAYGVSLFNFYQDNYFSSITNLLVAKQNKTIRHQGEAPDLLLGSLYLLYGLHDEASAIFNALTTSSSSLETKDHAWFYLAKLYYQKDQVEKARQALENIQGKIPEHRFSESINLLSNIYINKHQFNAAVSLVNSYDKKSTWDAYSKFNLGSSLIYNNRLDEGRSFLNQIAQAETRSQEQSALRDKANLALGYVALKLNNPEEAISHFNKISLNSALTSKALLGTGWAWNNMSLFDKALVPWMELKKHSALDPSVQESMIAIPYAMEKIEKPELALQYYNKAITDFQSQSQKLDLIISDINNGNFIQSLLPTSLDQESYLDNLNLSQNIILASPYFHDLFSTQRFQENLRNLQDLTHLQYIINRWHQNLPAFKLMLHERKSNYQHKLTELKNRRNTTILNELIKKKDKLAISLSNIEKKADALALASNEEHTQLASLKAIRKSINNIPAEQDISELKEKYDRLYGLIYWNLNTDFMPRLWSAKKSINELNTSIVDSISANSSLEMAALNAPKGFQGYSQRIAEQDIKIKNLAMRISAALEKQKSIINSLALISANQHKDRLNSYQLRARYSLARLYDKQAKQTGDGDD